MGKALDAEERLHVCFTINASIISVKHFTCDLFHFRYLFKMRCNSLKCVIIFVVRKQVLCHYFNELSFFVVYKEKKVKSKALKWFSSFLEKLQLLLKPRLIRCLILQLLPLIPTVNNLPILCLQFLKAVMKLSQ